MVFWGIEVKPNQPVRFDPEEAPCPQLHISQATLGDASVPGSKAKDRAVVAIKLEDGIPPATEGAPSDGFVRICILAPEKAESCSLDLVLSDPATFSVSGQHSVHLSGYYMPEGEEDVDMEDEGDSDEEGEEEEEEAGGQLAALKGAKLQDFFNGIADDDDDDDEDDDEMDEEDEEGYSDEEEDDEDDEDDEDEDDGVVLANTPQTNVRIKEIKDDAEEEDEDGFLVGQKRSAPETNSKKSEAKEKTPTQPPPKKKAAVEAENGKAKAASEPASTGKAKQTVPASEKVTPGKVPEQTWKKGELAGGEAKGEGGKDSAKKKGGESAKKKVAGTGAAAGGGDAAAAAAVAKGEAKAAAGKKQGTAGTEAGKGGEDRAAAVEAAKTSPAEKGKAGKTKGAEGKAVEGKGGEGKGKEGKKEGSVAPAVKPSTEKKGKEEQAGKDVPSAVKPKKPMVRTFSNGLKIEELQMGKPEAKVAKNGKRVSMRYIGKLKNGKIFDSNVSGKPFSFRLGVGEVIKGWDVGVEGMRVGDKRKLTIPPQFAYGAKGAPPDIPPNSWLTFDVELVDVK